MLQRVLVLAPLQENELNFDLIESLKNDNEKFKTTTFSGMRK